MNSTLPEVPGKIKWDMWSPLDLRLNVTNEGGCDSGYFPYTQPYTMSRLHRLGGIRKRFL